MGGLKRKRSCMEPVRVLHVFASLDRGGAESMVMNVYRSIDRERLQFDFVANESDREYAFEKEVKALGGRVYRIPKCRGANFLSYAHSWNRLLDAHPEWLIVHAHDPAAALICLAAARIRDRVTIAHSHTCGGATMMRSVAKTALCYPLRYIADHLFACSGRAARWMFGPDSVRALIVKNAIDAIQYTYNPVTRSSKRSELGISGKFVVGHVGRFTAEKNHARLVDIFSRVHSHNKNAVLVLVGDGVLRQSIAEKVSSLGLSDSVIFTGERSDVPELLQAMDVFVFPSLYEGLGIAAIEAQAAGLRCVVADTVPEEARVTGLFEAVPLTASSDVWSDKILRWIDGYERSSTLESIRAQRYDVQQTCSQVQQFYLQEARRKHVRK